MKIHSKMGNLSFSASSGTVTETASYTYDDNGNMLTETTNGVTKNYTCDDFNRLITYSSGSTTASYTYSTNNLRASKTVNGTTTTFVWNGQNLASETKSGTTTAYTYDPTGIISSKTGSAALVRFIKDPHGNVVATSQNNSVFGTYDYTAFGKQLEATNTTNPFRYCGEYYDNESGLTYLRNRYYNSQIGRFISEDPIRDGANWYVYGNNNPITFVDPWGLITASKEDADTVFEQLQKLTDDKLGYETLYDDNGEDTGKVEFIIKQRYATHRHVGQTLVSDLIDYGDKVNINVGGYINPDTQKLETNLKLSADANGIINIYIDPDDTLNLGKPVANVGTISSLRQEEIPEYIALGHELVHAWREFHGMFDPQENEGYSPFDFQNSTGQTTLIEELETVGLNYYNSQFVKARNYLSYEGIISENGLRLENGLPLRVNYR